MERDKSGLLVVLGLLAVVIFTGVIAYNIGHRIGDLEGRLSSAAEIGRLRAEIHDYRQAELPGGAR